jgi:outer membrane protein assembly factor BamE (lipoprotein component of BamABCDE complex)
MLTNNNIKFILILLLISLIQGCTKNNDLYHGYTFNDIENIEGKIKSIKTNKATKSEVVEILGSPTIENKRTFLYIENIFIQKPFFGPKNTQNKILQVDFNDSGTVVNVSFKIIPAPNHIVHAKEKTQVESGNITTFDKIKHSLKGTNKY